MFPMAMAQTGEAREVARQLIDEHDDMRARIRAFEEDATTQLDERLMAFGELLKGHIHTEERVLFERMQAELDAAALQALGVRLDAVRVRRGRCGLPEVVELSDQRADRCASRRASARRDTPRFFD